MKRIAFLLAFSLPAAADEVTLKSGGKIEGIVKSEGEKIVVETGTGELTLEAKDVASITKGRSKLHEYYEKAEKAKSAAELYDLSHWARDNGCPKFVTSLLQRVIALEPEHEMARRGLGFEIHKGRWMTKAEIYRDMGYVEFEGKWISKEERDLIVLERTPARPRFRVAVEEEETLYLIRPSYPRYYYDYYHRPYGYPIYPAFGTFGTFGGGGSGGSPFFTNSPRWPPGRSTGYGRQIP